MKKLVALLLTTALLVSLCTCALATEEPITLRLYGTANFIDQGEEGVMNLITGTETPGYNVIIQRWEELHPNVKLSIETCPWDSWLTSIQTAVLAGGVDIILHGATLTELCEPLDDYLAKDPEYAAKIFATENKRFGELDKTMVAGIQYCIEPSIAYIDVDILSHYGVEVPTAAWTWDELIDIAEKCTGTDPVTGKQTYGIQLSYTNTQNIFQNYYMMAYACNAAPITYGATAADSTIDVSGEKITKIFTQIARLAACCSANVREGINVNHDLTADNDTAIHMRTLAYDQYMKIKAQGVADQYAFVPLPVVEEGPNAGAQSTYFGSYNLALCNTSEHKDWAWEFIKFMTTDEVAVQWTIDTGCIPNCEYGMTLLKDRMGEKAEAPMQVLATLPKGFCNTTNENYDNVNFGTFSTSLVTVLKDLVYGTTTPEEAQAQWQAAIEEYMASVK